MVWYQTMNVIDFFTEHTTHKQMLKSIDFESTEQFYIISNPIRSKCEIVFELV